MSLAPTPSPAPAPAGPVGMAGAGALPSRLAQFYALTKPRVVQLIVFCAFIGMVLAVPSLPSRAQWGLMAIASAGIWLVAGAAAPENVEPDVIPNALEQSNVSAINGVIDLILTQRAFQMYSKTAETIDTMNQSAINQVGKRN